MSGRERVEWTNGHGREHRFTVLFVSTGNVCRSPMAQLLAEWEMTRTLGPAAAMFRFASAGTWGHDGAAMEQHARTVLAEHGAAESSFVARELLPEQVAAADLVLTATAEQRHQIQLSDPDAADRAFTLREFARLAGALNLGPEPTAAPARARAIVEAAAQLRARSAPTPCVEDIADPYGAPLHVFRLCAAEILECLTAFVGTVVASTTPSSGRAAG